MKTEFKVASPLFSSRPYFSQEITSRQQFSDLLGTVYCQGNLLFTHDGTCLLSPVGNRVTVFDLIKYVAGVLQHSEGVQPPKLTSSATSPTLFPIRTAEIYPD